MVAAVNGGYLYTSSDFVTWTAMRAPVAAWQSVTMSADGTKVFAVVAPGLIYTSMDSGATWSPTPAPRTYWTSIASSGDGTMLVAGADTWPPPAFGGEVCTSTNSGASWRVVPDQPGPFNSVAASADGTTFLAVGFYPGPGVFGELLIDKLGTGDH